MADPTASSSHDSSSGPDVPVDRQAFEYSVDRLVSTILRDRRMGHFAADALPDRAVVERIIERIAWLMFPGFFGPRDWTRAGASASVRRILAELATDLAGQIEAAMLVEHVRRTDRRAAVGDANAAATSGGAPGGAAGGECADARNRTDGAAPAGAPALDRAAVHRSARRVTENLLAELAHIRDLLSLDVQAAADGDPAAMHTDEAIFCYPGVYAVMVHRIAHELYLSGVPFLPRIMNELAHAATGIDIHPGARIGRSFFIDHGTGVVIGETTQIGDHCTLYQGVTLGATGFPRHADGSFDRSRKRHPTLEDHVTVYAGATILGGETVIGAGTVVNGGVFLTTSVAPGHVVRAPRSEVTLRTNPSLPPPNWTI